MGKFDNIALISVGYDIRCRLCGSGVSASMNTKDSDKSGEEIYKRLIKKFLHENDENCKIQEKLNVINQVLED